MILGLCLILVLAGAMVTPAGAAGPRATIVEHSAARIVFEYTTPAWRLDSLRVEGETYRRVSVPGFMAPTDAGRPEIPFDVVSLGVPVDRVARVSVQVMETEDVPDVLPPPVPGQSFGKAGTGELASVQPVMRLVRDAEAYSDAGLQPLENAKLTGMRWLRHQRIAQLAVQPFRYRASTRTLYVTKQMRVTVTLTPDESSRRGGPGVGSPRYLPAPAEPPGWDGVYGGALLNAKQSRGWRVMRAPAAAPSASRGAGRTPSAAPARAHAAVNDLEYKLRVTQTGFYRVPFGSLTGFPAGIPVGDIKVFQREYVGGATPIVEHRKPVRIIDQDANGLFGSGDAVIFHGLSFRDQWMTSADWEDAKSDTNAYWLSFESGAGSPAMAVEGSWRDFASPARPDSFVTSDHEERDLLVFDWSVRRPMDMYYWVLADSSRTGSVPVNFPGIVATRPVDVDFRVVLQGVKGPYQSGEQGTSALVTMNLARPSGGDVLLGSFTHYYTGVPFDFHATFSGSGWVNGTDSYNFRYVSQATKSYHETLLDWYRVTYTRRYQLESYENRLRFHNNGVTGPLEYTVRGFPEASIDLYRFDAAGDPVSQTVTAGQVTPSGGRFDLRLQYDEADSTAFEAVAASGYLQPVSITAISGQVDLAGDPLAPDYLMITWDAFAAGLDPLVAHRGAQGYRVRVAPVSRVYDVFGNGIPSIQAIKNYIRHGYETWNTGYALLVGDANKDQRGVGVHFPVLPSGIDYIPTYYEADWEGPAVEVDYPIRPVDNWYADVSPVEDPDWVPDVALGRMPVGNTGELAAIIQKTIQCETPAGGNEDWRRRVLFTADDEYTFTGYDPLHDCWAYSNDQFEVASVQMESVVDASACGRALGTSLHLSGELYEYPESGTGRPAPYGTCIPEGPTCCVDVGTFIEGGGGVQEYALHNYTPALFDSLNDGVLIWDYQGHANRYVLTHEYVYVETPSALRQDHTRYTNLERPFILLGYACYISQFEIRTEPELGDGIGERMVLAPNGGAAALYASPGLELLYQNTSLNAALNNVLWSPSYSPDGSSNLILGPAIGAGVAVFAATGDSPNRWRSYQLLGDPALRIEMGAPLATVTVNDSLAEDGDFLAEFVQGGTAHIVATFADEGGVQPIQLVNTSVGPDPLVEGVDYHVIALVDSGAPAPRRLQLTYDTTGGLISSEIVMTAIDVHGHATTFTLKSGVSISPSVDGRAIRDGSVLGVRDSVRLEVRVDAPLAIDGDSLGLRLDGVDRQDVIRTPLASRGAESAALANSWLLALSDTLTLALGPHTLAVTLVTGGVTMVVDSITFSVQADVDLVYALAYPNPFPDATTLVYYSELPADRVEVDIYTVSGKRVRRLATDAAQLQGQNQLAWDGKDEKGDAVASGAYFFRLRAHSSAGKVTETIGRLVKIAR